MALQLLETACAVSMGDCVENVLEALKRDLPSVSREQPRSGRLAIVASGPSAKDHIDTFRNWDGELWAINGALGWLVDEEIIPDAFVAVDPGYGMHALLTERPEKTTYYIASVCDPLVFNALRWNDVVVWHSLFHGCPYPKGEPIVNGGTTCATRAPYLAHVLGWRDITIYGVDSSYADRVYCYDESKYACSRIPDVKMVRVGDELFPTNIQMVHQATELCVMQEQFRGQLKIVAGGLLAALLAAPVHPLAEFEQTKAA